MNFLEYITKLLNKVYRLDTFINVWLTPISYQITKLYNQVSAIHNNFFFDSLDVEGCRHYEKLLNIVSNESDTLENRRARIQAKWLSNNHNSIALIQNICESWQDGEVTADFLEGKIKLQFKTIGTPKNLSSLLDAINVVKPAHIPLYTLFRYLIIEEIHEVKTIEEMEQISLDEFEF